MPNHDLIAVWEEHLRSEFVAHDADAAMDTMVPDACVNHVPTMSLFVGRYRSGSRHRGPGRPLRLSGWR